MDAINGCMSGALGAFLSWFGGSRPFAALLVVSAAAGILLAWLIRLLTDQAALRRTKRRLQAHLLEFRLFRDEPAILWRAQKAMFLLNLRYFRLMLPALALIFPPMAFLMLHLDCFYGRRALNPGEAAVVTIQLKGSRGKSASPPEMAAEGSVAVETPPVRLPHAGQFSWRIRALRPDAGALRIEIGGEEIHKPVEAGSGSRPVVPRRSSAFLEWLRYPAEARLHSTSVAWVGIDYPAAEVGAGVLRSHWVVWFAAVSAAAALLAGRRLGAAF